MSFRFLHVLISTCYCLFFRGFFFLFVCFSRFCLFSDNSYPCGCEVVDFLTL